MAFWPAISAAVAPATALSALLLISPAAAQPAAQAPAAQASTAQERPVMLLVGGSVSWDSNVFLLSDTENAPQTPSGESTKSDRITSLYVGLRVDKPYAQQRFQIAVTKTAYRYDNFPHLDFEPLDYSAAWLWQLTPRVSGRLSADRTESLASYADFTDVTQRNVVTTETRVLSADASVFGGWHLLAGATKEERDNSVPFIEQGDYRAAGGDVGVRYVTSAGNSLSLRVRSLDGNYTEQALDPVAFIDTGFRQSDSEFVAAWKPSGKTTLDLGVGVVDYRSDNFVERDFSGTSARAAFGWSPTTKLALGFAASRDLSAWTADFASYRVDSRLSFAPSWQIGPRTAVRLSLERVDSDYRKPIPTFTGEPRSDTLKSILLAATWKPLRNLSIDASVQRQRRTSTDPTSGFEASSATLSAALLF